MDRPAEYDPRYCAMQDKTIEQVADRVQRLVDEYHGNNVGLANLRGQLDAIIARVPADLTQRLSVLEVKHDGLHKDFLLLRGQLFTVIGSILLTGIGAVVTWIVRGGMR